MNYYKVQDAGCDIRIIVAASKYEAVGYYLYEVQNGSGCIDDIEVESLSPDHKVEVSCIGFPTYKTVQELHREKECWDSPAVVEELID